MSGEDEAKRTSGREDDHTHLVLDELREDPVGRDRAHLNDEYVAFKNEGEAPLNVSGWTVENAAGRTYRFPNTVIEPGERVTLHSGRGTDGPGHRYWNADDPVWDNRADTVTVRTEDGERVLRESYEG